MSTESNHHVAWADRLGINKILHEAINECRLAYGTELYRIKVLSLYHLIPNVKDGPQLKTMIEKYKTDIWEKKIHGQLEKWKKDNPDLQYELSIIQDESEKLHDDMMPDLFDYMYQLLEEKGFGFYRSDLSTDQISLTSNSESEEFTEET